MSADAFLDLVGSHHHGQRVPAHQALDAALHFLAAGKGRLLDGRDGVLVGGGRGERQVDAGSASGVQGNCCSSRPARSGPPSDRT